MLQKLRQHWQALFNSTGRVAATSGDFTFLFKTWQGYLILFTGPGISTTMTRGICIPSFITRVISDSILYSILLTMAMRAFLCVLIADEVGRAVMIREQLQKRTELERMTDRIMAVIS